MKYLLFIYCIITSSFISTLFAENYKWIVPYDDSGNTISYLSTPANWDPVGVPGLVDTILVDNNGEVSIILKAIVTSATLTESSILMISNFNVSNTLTMNGFKSSIGITGGAVLQATSTNIDNGSIMVYPVGGEFQFPLFDGFFIDSTIELNGLASIINENGAGLYIQDTILNLYTLSTIYNMKGSTLYLLGLVSLYDNCHIFDMGGNFMGLEKINFYNSSVLSIGQNSNVTLFNSILLQDQSSIKISNSSVFFVMGSLKMTSNSTVTFENSNHVLVLIDGDMTLGGSSKFKVTGFNSTVLVSGKFVSLDNSMLTISNNSNFYIGGKSTLARFISTTIDSSSSLHIEGDTTINGYFSSSNNSQIIVLSKLIIDTFYSKFENSIIYSFGDIKVYDVMIVENTIIQIDKGNFITFQSSYLSLENSKVTLVNGQVYIHESSYINLINSSFIIENGGSLQTFGNMYINSNSNLKNVGTISINSGIYYSKDDISIKTNNVTISNFNGGIVNVSSSSIGSNTVDINIGFINYGQLNLNTSLYVHDLSIVENGTLSLNSGSQSNSKISSDSIIKLNGGQINGNGLINSSITQTNGEFGSNKFVNSFNITGDFIQNTIESKIKIVIEDYNSFSNINIEKLANLTGEIEIKISDKVLNNLDSIASSSSSSSSGSDSIGLKLSLINYSATTNSNFSKITFKSYNPETGDESDLDDNDCRVSSSKSSSSFSVLLGGDENCNKSGGIKLSKGAMAGIIIGCVAAVVIVGVILVKKDRISLRLRQSYTVVKLKSVLSKK